MGSIVVSWSYSNNPHFDLFDDHFISVLCICACIVFGMVCEGVGGGGGVRVCGMLKIVEMRSCITTRCHILIGTLNPIRTYRNIK